jgi:two-component system phosphate regulon sensor histidine kinase PhoR
VDIVDEVLKHQKWVHMNHIFRADLAPDLPEIQADYGQIRQVLINLVENATAYSEEGTEIKIRAKVIDNNIEVSVSDEGVGILRMSWARCSINFTEVPRSVETMAVLV